MRPKNNQPNNKPIVHSDFSPHLPTCSSAKQSLFVIYRVKPLVESSWVVEKEEYDDQHESCKPDRPANGSFSFFIGPYGFCPLTPCLDRAAC